MDLENITTGRIYDVTNCDREPIHVPGAIQPHGFLLAIREPDLIIEQLGENLGAFLGQPAADLLGKKIEDLFTADTMQEIQGALCLPDVRSNNPLTAQFIGREDSFTTTLHRHGETMILELEKATEADGAKRLDRYHRTRQAISKLRAARSLDELCATACEQVRSLTGLDRVVVYFFDRDWNGAVISESRSEGTESFMGLHFPASDIPRQARALYSQNWLRLIPNVSYAASPIVPALNPRTGAPLDLSFSILRSVSPLHIEYLNNMGLTASMSVSLMKGDQLWGLISCAGLNGPRYISFETRAACEFIGEVVSSLLAEKSQLE
ncbi:MAG: GAF domain-containing protein, partial [Proteobacteria bacterium]